MLRGEIIAAQGIDAGVAHIKRGLIEGGPKVNYFHMDEEDTLWFKDCLGVPRTMSCARRYLIKLTLPNNPPTCVAQRCIMI
jgi:hypothetical protein